MLVESVAFAPVAVGACGDGVIQALSNYFAVNDVDVINTDALVHRLAERGESLGTFVDPSRALQIGNILGPTVMLVVREDRCDTERSEYTRTEKRKRYVTRTETTRSDSEQVERTRAGPTSTRAGTTNTGTRQEAGTERTETRIEETYEIPVYYSKTESFLGVSVQAIDLATGRIFKVRMLGFSHSDSNKSEQGYPEFPSETGVRDIAARQVVHRMAQWFLPYPVRNDFVFFDTESKYCNLKAAHQTFKGLDFERALDLSAENARICMNSPNKKFRSNAHYNLGVVYRAREEHDLALESFQRAADLNPERTIIWDAISETTRTVEEWRALAEPEVLDQSNLPIANTQINSTTTSTVQEEPVQQAFSNADVIQLTQAKIPLKVVISKIKTASNCEFDLSVEALSRLVEAGVSEDVIVAMMEKDSQ